MTDDSGSEESRSERLRKRRSRRNEASPEATPDADGGSSEVPPDTNSTSISQSGSESGNDSSTVDGTIKDEQVGTYMYIPKAQKKEIQRCYNVLKAEYEYEFETTFEKNRHFYPLLIQYGLDSLDGLDATEIQNRLESL